MTGFILAIDQGTTNSRALLFDLNGLVLGRYSLALNQYYPRVGWVEQDPNQMFNNIIKCCLRVIAQTSVPVNKIAAIGITNQRETTILWNKQTGEPIYPAIVWQDRRTVELCKRLATLPISKFLHDKTGLLIDPYFSLSKVLWIFENIPAARALAKKNELLFGTVDTYLLWRLTKGGIHATDPSNASRTLMFNINTQEWDQEILQNFAIPMEILPKVYDNAGYFGELDHQILGKAIPIMGMAGDQQAAGIGQACFSPGMLKATYGTGGFLMLNKGNRIIKTNDQLLTTVYYRLQNKVTYGLEGTIFSAGNTIQWLHDNLHLINDAKETEILAKSIKSTNGVYLIPGFTGLGAPYWTSAKAAILGLTLNSKKEHIVRAALESIAYQTLDLLTVMQFDNNILVNALYVDGGMSANRWLMQFLANILNLPIYKAECIESSARGAAFLAGLGVGIYKSLEDIKNLWQKKEEFQSEMAKSTRNKLYRNWQAALNHTINYKEHLPKSSLTSINYSTTQIL